MGQRVKIGKISGSTYGIQVTKPGKSFTDSPAPTSKDMSRISLSFLLEGLIFNLYKS